MDAQIVSGSPSTLLEQKQKDFGFIGEGKRNTLTFYPYHSPAEQHSVGPGEMILDVSCVPEAWEERLREQQIGF